MNTEIPLNTLYRFAACTVPTAYPRTLSDILDCHLPNRLKCSKFNAMNLSGALIMIIFLLDCSLEGHFTGVPFSTFPEAISLSFAIRTEFPFPLSEFQSLKVRKKMYTVYTIPPV